MKNKNFITAFKTSMTQAENWREVKEIMNETIDYVNENLENFTENHVKIIQAYFENHPTKGKEETTTKKIIPLSRINVVLKSGS